MHAIYEVDGFQSLNVWLLSIDSTVYGGNWKMRNLMLISGLATYYQSFELEECHRTEGVRIWAPRSVPPDIQVLHIHRILYTIIYLIQTPSSTTNHGRSCIVHYMLSFLQVQMNTKYAGPGGHMLFLVFVLENV